MAAAWVNPLSNKTSLKDFFHKIDNSCNPRFLFLFGDLWLSDIVTPEISLWPNGSKQREPLCRSFQRGRFWTSRQPASLHVGSLFLEVNLRLKHQIDSI